MVCGYFREDDSRTYDVRANAGDFIIGEVGRIDINSGQTLEVNSETSRTHLSKITEKYSGSEIHSSGE